MEKVTVRAYASIISYCTDMGTGMSFCSHCNGEVDIMKMLNEIIDGRKEHVCPKCGSILRGLTIHEYTGGGSDF